MLGSAHDADDALQDALLGAWRGIGRFEGRSSVRSWLHRIAVNAAIRASDRRRRRDLPFRHGPSRSDVHDLGEPVTEAVFVEPYPDAELRAEAHAADPAARYELLESVELAFVAALQELPASQRAVLVLRDVLAMPAAEVAEALDTSPVAVNSALQRARATLREQLGERLEWTHAAGSSDAERRLLDRYLEAHERQDVDGLAALLREDARLTMPPHAVWFDGRAAIVHASAKGFDPDFGELRGARTGANLQPAVGWYLRPPGGDSFQPLAFDVLRIEDGAIATITSFVLPDLFAELGLPARL
jgi:RNA polymerase sigma-70 factor, ECF subfamily